VPKSKKQLVQQYVEAVGRGDIDTVLSLVTDDYTHEFLGSTFLAGTRQLGEVLERISAFNAALVSGAKFTFHDLVEEGDLVLGIFSGESELKGGGRFDGVYAISCRFRGDRLHATKELVDTKLADSLQG
jgi:ketosteroid isomerase-like protein